MVLPMSLASMLLFAAGVAISYVYVVPMIVDVLQAFKTPSKAPQKAAGKAPSRPPQSFRTRRTGPPAQAVSRRWPAIAAAVVAVLGGAYGGFEYTRWQPAEQIEAERRVAEAAAAKKKADEAEARRLQEERIAAEKRASEERARQAGQALGRCATTRKKPTIGLGLERGRANGGRKNGWPPKSVRARRQSRGSPMRLRPRRNRRRARSPGR
jgi:hypothetical protein